MKFNKKLENIEIYEAGKPIELVVREYGIEPKDIVKLASNENPYGTSQKVKDAVSAIISKMSLYPDDSMTRLKNALSQKYALGQENIIIGSGSDQVIEFLIHAKADSSSTILMNSVTFAMYEIYARHIGASVVRTASIEHDMDEFYELYLKHKPEIIFICTPNNPTGDALDRERLYDFLSKIDSDTLVVVDGAYMEYAAYKDATKAISPQHLITTYKNVIYLGTFSKAYGLGGMRIGYGLADALVIKELYKLRPPFNITTLSLEAASVALEDEEFVNFSITQNFSEMKRYEEFAKLHKIDIIESFTNFVTFVFSNNLSSTYISGELLKQGMIVRNLGSYNMNAIRVTVGTAEQNSRFFELFEKFL